MSEFAEVHFLQTNVVEASKTTTKCICRKNIKTKHPPKMPKPMKKIAFAEKMKEKKHLQNKCQNDKKMQ